MRLFLLLSLLFVPFFAPCGRAQKVLLLEKMTRSAAEKMYTDAPLRFRMDGDKFWQEGRIQEMRPDIQALVINDRYIMLDQIATIDQGITPFGVAGYSLMTFGTAWSFWALAGNLTDGDASTNYSTSDLTVSLTSIGTGYLLTRLLGRKRFRTGPRKRLRIVDTSF